MFTILGKFVQFLIDAVVAVANTVGLLFPPSPFDLVIDSRYADFLADINFFIPIYEFLAIGQAWLLAVGVYYGVSVIARWVKAIE